MTELEVRHLAFGYEPSRRVLDDVSLTYRSPDTLCLLGANGTGKSTLLKIIIGECRPQGGVVLLDGRPTSSYSARQLARKIAYIPQSHVPAFAFSVLDVVLMGRTARLGYFASPGRSDRALAMQRLDFLQIAHLRDQPYTDISGGERQLVMIAAALNQDPEVLILDEPTSHLDFGNQYRFLHLVDRLRAEGRGVIMTTHFPDHALELGGTTAVLKDKSILAVGSASEVVTAPVLSDIYQLDVQVETIHDRRVCIPGPLTTMGHRRTDRTDEP